MIHSSTMSFFGYLLWSVIPCVLYKFYQKQIMRKNKRIYPLLDLFPHKLIYFKDHNVTLGHLLWYGTPLCDIKIPTGLICTKIRVLTLYSKAAP